MATTTNYGWTTPDDTALVKDGAAAIRTLGSSVDTTTKALNPSTTLGDIEYRSSTANTNTRLGIGTTGQVLSVSGGVPSWQTPSGVATYAIFRDEKTSGTAGGTFTTGAWRTRDLQTTQINQITGASLASNQITLDAGTYRVTAFAPANSVNYHTARLYNITDSSVTILGTAMYSDAATAAAQNQSIVEGIFTIAGSKVFELQHYATETKSTYGFGLAASISANIFTVVSIAKI